MSNRLFQGVIHQMQDAVEDRTIGVIDEAGVIIACSTLSNIGELRNNVREEVNFSGDMFVSEGYTYRPLNGRAKSDYIIFVEGDDKLAEKFSQILAVSLDNIKTLHDEKFDKGSFIKNIILDNILPSDIYVKSKELHFPVEETRAVFLIKFLSKTEMMPYEIVSNIFPDKQNDYVISVGDREIVVVKDVKAGSESKDLVAIANNIIDILSTDFFVKATVGISSVVENLKDLAKAYKEAQIALDVGKVFDNEKNILNYENLGIGRLIYQLPNTLCEMFLGEVFKKGNLESLDKETMQTIQVFFENNLNVSETARELFVHRNTLVYRLEKIRRITGLDLREFDNAVTFKVALMVKKYLNSKNTKF